MPIIPHQNEDGSYRAYNADEQAAFRLKWRGVRDGSTPTLSFEINSNRGEAECEIDPTQFDHAILYLIGASGLYEVEEEVEGEPVTVKKITRLLPFRMPGRPGLVVTKILSVNGQKFERKQPGVNVPAGGWPEYKYALVKLLFETPRYNLAADADTVREVERFVDEEPGEGTSQTIATLGGTLKYLRDPSKPNPTAAPNGETVNANTLFKTVVEEVFQMTMWRVPADMVAPGSDWFTRVYGIGEQYDVPLLGAINKEEFAGRPVGTVLLDSVKRIKDVSPLGDGTFEYRIVGTFKFKPSGWNWLYFSSVAFPDVNDFYYVGNTTFKTADVVGPRESVYAAADLNRLFEP